MLIVAGGIPGSQPLVIALTNRKEKLLMLVSVILIKTSVELKAIYLAALNYYMIRASGRVREKMENFAK